MKKVLFIAAALLAAIPAYAADVGAPAPVPKARPLSYICTQQSCSGFYLGVNLMGQGANLTDVSSGVPLNAFTSGGGMGLDAGYQFWNGQIGFGAEVFADYNALNLGTGNGFRNTYLIGEVGKIGYGFPGLFGGAGTGTTTGSQTPVPLSVPAGLTTSLLFPYFAAGAVERPWGTGWAVGAGINYILSANWNVDIMYLNVNYNNANVNSVVFENQENLVKIGLHYHM